MGARRLGSRYSIFLISALSVLGLSLNPFLVALAGEWRQSAKFRVSGIRSPGTFPTMTMRFCKGRKERRLVLPAEIRLGGGCAS